MTDELRRAVSVLRKDAQFKSKYGSAQMALENNLLADLLHLLADREDSGLLTVDVLTLAERYASAVVQGRSNGLR